MTVGDDFIGVRRWLRGDDHLNLHKVLACHTLADEKKFRTAH